jgi:hypothetical protein
LDSLQAAWKGNNNDEELWYASSSDGSNWSAPAVIPGAASDVGPALDQLNGLEYAAWKGSNGDPEIYYSSAGTSGWAPQQLIPGGSDVGPSLAQYNNLLYAAWKGSNGDQEIWYSSFDGSGWAAQQVIPGVATDVGPSLAAWDVDSGGDGRLYAAWVGGDGDPRLFYSSFDGSTWAPQQVIPGVGSSVGPSLRVIYNQIFAAWVGADGDQQLYYSSFDGSNWAPQQVIPGVASDVGPALAVFNGLLYAAWRGANGDQRVFYTSFDGSNWAPQAVIPGAGSDPVPAPVWGLGSNSNYIMASDCNPVTGLSVTITATEDIVWQSASGPTEGFGFQLNAYSPTGDLDGYQQYLIWLGGPELIGQACNFGPNGPLFNHYFNLTSLPTVTLPAGYVLQISLQNDNDGNITGATYDVFDNQGNVLANTPVELLSIEGVTSADLAPIIAFELDFVGPTNGESAVLSSGAGWIAYQASSPLTVLSQEPPCINSPVVTEETTNSSYSPMPPVTSNEFVQPFSVSAAATMIRKEGKLRPGLIVPRAQASVKPSPAEQGAPSSR